MPTRVIAGSYGQSMFYKSCQAVLQSGFMFPMAMMTAPMAPHPHQHLVLLVVQILAVVGVYWYLLLICISLVIHDVEHLFIYYFPSDILFGEVSYLLRSLVHFLIWSFSCCVFRVLYMLDNIPLSDMSFENICSQLWLVSSRGTVFHRAEVFSEVHVVNYFFHGSCLWCCI